MFDKLFSKFSVDDPQSFGVIKLVAEKLQEHELILLIDELFKNQVFDLASEIAKSSNLESVLVHSRNKLLQDFNLWIKQELIYHSSIEHYHHPKLIQTKKFEFISFFNSFSKLGFSDEIKQILERFIIKGNKSLTGKIFTATFQALLRSFNPSLIEELGLFLFSISDRNTFKDERIHLIINSFLNEVAFTSVIFELSSNFTFQLNIQKQKLFVSDNLNKYSFKNYFLLEIIINKGIDLSDTTKGIFILQWLEKLDFYGFHNTELLKFLSRFNFNFNNYDFKSKLNSLRIKLDYSCQSLEEDELKINSAKYFLENSEKMSDYIIFHLENLQSDDILPELIKLKNILDQIIVSLNELVGFSEFNQFKEIKGIKTRKKEDKKSKIIKKYYLVDILNRDIILKGKQLIEQLNSSSSFKKDNLITLKKITSGFLGIHNFQIENSRPQVSKVDIENPNHESFFIQSINYSLYNRGQMFVLTKKNEDIFRALNKLSFNRLFGKIDFWVFNQLIKNGIETKYSELFISKLSEYFNFYDFKRLNIANNEFEDFIRFYYPEFHLLLDESRNQEKSWAKINECYVNNKICFGTVLSKSKGGLKVDLFGIEAFLPGSQIDIKPVQDYDLYIDKQLNFKVVKINHELRNVVVSHLEIVKEEIELKKKEVISSLEKGLVLRGYVKNISSYGIFVDLGGIDGLVHLNDLSWSRIDHPKDFFEINQEINVVVLDFDSEKKRIALGLKQLHADPWETMGSNFKVGSIVNGKISRISKYGIFVKFVNGIEGLVHKSNLSWTRGIIDVSKLYKVGDKIDTIILLINEEERKVSLGIKQLIPDPWEVIEAKYAVGTRHKPKVRNFTNFGVFVELEEGVDGLIHISDLSWQKKIRHPSEFCKVGDEMEVVVLEIDRENRRISLGHKQLEENPWDVFETIFREGSVHQGTIIATKDKAGIVSLPYGVEGICPSKHLRKEDGSNAKVEETLDFKVIEFNKDAKKIVVSHSNTLRR